MKITHKIAELCIQTQVLRRSSELGLELIEVQPCQLYATSKGIVEFGKEPNPWWWEIDADNLDAMESKAIQVVEWIHNLHGPGRVWHVDRMVHVVNDDDMWKFRDGYNDRLICRLRTFSAHEDTAT